MICNHNLSTNSGNRIEAAPMPRFVQNNRWLTIVPVILLAAWLAGRQLNTWAFAPDESHSMITAGARDFGPRSIADTLQVGIVREWDQAFGWMLAMNLWGKVVGWSTVAIRAFSWLAGLLTLATVYRAGRSFFTHEAGLIAALLLMVSTLFVSYMHVARVYTLVTLFSTLLLWSYWRLAIDPRLPSRKHLPALLLGGVGLFYTQFLAALMVPLVGVFHLFFARRGRYWWQVTTLLALAGLSFIPQLTVLLRGMENYSSGAFVPQTAAQMTVRLLHTLTNSLVSPPQLAGPPLLLVLILLLVVLLWRRPREGPNLAWFFAGIVLLHFLLILAVNEVIGVLRYLDRVRYFLVLWPPIALLAGYGIWQLRHRYRRLAEWLLVALVASGIALNLRSGIYLSYATYDHTLIHLADQALQQQARPDDLLLMEEVGLNAFYEKNLHQPRVVFSRGSDSDVVARQVAGHERVWLLARGADSVIEGSLSEDLRRCNVAVRRKDLVLTLYARSEADCD